MHFFVTELKKISNANYINVYTSDLVQIYQDKRGQRFFPLTEDERNYLKALIEEFNLNIGNNDFFIQDNLDIEYMPKSPQYRLYPATDYDQEDKHLYEGHTTSGIERSNLILFKVSLNDMATKGPDEHE